MEFSLNSNVHLYYFCSFQHLSYCWKCSCAADWPAAGPSWPHLGLVAFCVPWHMIQGSILKGGMCCSKTSKPQDACWCYVCFLGASLVAQLIKNPPTLQQIPVQFLSQEDPLEKGLATHSSILGLPWWLRQQRICLQYGKTWVQSWVGKIPWRKAWQPSPVFPG